MVVDKTEESITIRSLNPKRSTKYMTKKYAGATHNRDSQITLEPVLRSPAQESNDMTPDTFVLLLFRSKVTHAGPCQPTTWKGSAKGSRTQRKPTVGKTLAISWLPVTERARSTTIARRALVLSGLVLELQIFQKGWFTLWPIRTYASQLYQVCPDHLPSESKL